MTDRLITIKEAQALFPFGSRTTFYTLRKNDPTFPKPVLFGRRKGFSEREIQQWIETKLATRES